MKTYEKPRLIAMSLSGSNTLCSSCEIDIVGDNVDEIIKGFLEILDEPFSSGDNCKDVLEIEGYCKFTATTILTNS